MSKLGTMIGLVLLAVAGCRLGTAPPSSLTAAAPVVSPPADAITTRPTEVYENEVCPASGIENESSVITLAAAQFEPTIPDVPQSTTGSNPVALRYNLMDSISQALAQNPDLVALRQNENIGLGVLDVAQTYPFNPFAQVRVTPYQDAVGAGVGTTYHYVLLMQRIELAHQQRYREQNAASNLNQIRWSIHSAELQNVGQSARLYFTALYQLELLNLAETAHDYNLLLKDTLEKQLQAGQASGADVEIARIDARATAQQVRLAQATFQSSVRDLKQQLGFSPETDLLLSDRLTELNWRMPTLIADGGGQPCEMNDPALLSNWAASRPDVLAALADVDAARANLDLASAAKVPDMQIGPYYQRSQDESTFLGLQAQMDIPVFNTGAPLERQRVAELNQRTTAWRQLFRRANLEAEAALQRYQLAYESLEESGLDEAIETPQALEGLERQFRAGEVDIIRVTQARNSILQNQRIRIDLYNELAQAAADLIQSVGLPVEEVVH
ncbi:TolC family protein [Bremerella alba]|uniref:Outer membrane efflux protein n=1 Tax=Bremerella alba TaxID=980252 RepID=A0A7V8V647_9BACT|nr:TolC family protein [Bremerella alba]MBA2115588.1 hypothetical protein [Bremerella alba]